jgi:hypothetical protein
MDPPPGPTVDVISRKVRRYLDAKAAYDRVCRQFEQDPLLKDSAPHARELREARLTWLLGLRTLTGHDLGAARQEERRRRISPKEDSHA